MESRNPSATAPVSSGIMDEMPARVLGFLRSIGLRAAAGALCLLTAGGAASAQWTTAPVTAPGVQYRTFSSAAAGATVSFHIYLPPDYANEPNRRFPVLYWLHGSGDPIAGITPVTSYLASGMAQGLIPPMIVVIPNGMNYSMWCNSKSGLVPMEDVVLDDLVPHIDATFRTIAQRSGRILDGFSMGGAGSGRFGFRRPDLFAGVSMLGAGPLQLDFLEEPIGGSTSEQLRLAIYEAVWGSDPLYYLSQNPRTIVTDRAEAVIAAQTRVRQGIGSLDTLVPMNQEFSALLKTLGIPHGYTVLPGIGHNAGAVLNTLGQANWDFYNAALATPCRRAADVNCDGVVNGVDLAALLANWGPGYGPEDLDGDGSVGGSDIAQVLSNWGPVP